MHCSCGERPVGTLGSAVRDRRWCGALDVQRLCVEHCGTIEQNRNAYHRKKGATELVTPALVSQQLDQGSCLAWCAFSLTH